MKIFGPPRQSTASPMYEVLERMKVFGNENHLTGGILEWKRIREVYYPKKPKKLRKPKRKPTPRKELLALV